MKPALSLAPAMLIASAWCALAETGGAPIPVTTDTFIRAATDIEFDKYLPLTGGVNQLFHFLSPTPIDQQPTIRMNRDTLYSMAIIDISAGATLTLPDPGERYMSTQVIDQDHFVGAVLDGGGSFDLDLERYDTPFLFTITRVVVDADDPEDIAAVNALQEQITIEAGAATEFVSPNYDMESFEGLLASLLEVGRYIPDSVGMFGAKDEVEPVRHMVGTAGGWGGLPETAALYLNIEPGLPVGRYALTVPADVPVDAFWSISLYNADGFFEENDLGAYNINSVTGTAGDDGAIIVHFGGCEDGRVNCLPIMEGWNYTVRLYQPGPALLAGDWSFPDATPVD